MTQPEPPTNIFRRLRDRAFEPADTSTLGITRCGYGAIMAWHFWLLLTTGLGAEIYQEPVLHFTYPGLQWLGRLPAPGMMVLLWTCFAAALLVAVGLAYRFAMPLFLVCFAYLYFHDVTAYSNLDYLALLCGFWLALAPANGSFSLDARLFASQRRHLAEQWPLWMVRLQVGIAYFYGAVIKLNEDWLAGEPVRTWAQQNAPHTVFGPVLGTEPVVMFLAYMGLFFDATIMFWLLWPRTRAIAVLATAIFHITNEHVFEVGVLPFFMIVVTASYLPPDFWARLRRSDDTVPFAPLGPASRKAVSGLMVVWAVWQIAFPLRHHFYPGDGRWTYEGQRFSWWWRHATLDIRADVWAEDAHGARTKLYPPDYLTPRQSGIFGDPHLVVQFAHQVAQRREGVVRMYADVRSSLNKRPEQQLIPPDIDLLAQPVTMGHYDWVVPLQPRPD